MKNREDTSAVKNSGENAAKYSAWRWGGRQTGVKRLLWDSAAALSTQNRNGGGGVPSYSAIRMNMISLVRRQKAMRVASRMKMRKLRVEHKRMEKKEKGDLWRERG